MNQAASPERLLTELDRTRICRLPGRRLTPPLMDLLDTAEVLDARDIPADTVTMFSQVEIENLHDGQRRTLTLCYPDHAEPHAGFISVLSPVGCALLGLRVGAIARWQLPGGESGAARVRAILFQPEASGDYTL